MTTNLTKTEYSHLVDRYKDFRKIIIRLYNIDLPKYLSKNAFDVCGKKLGLLRDDILVLGDMDQTAVLMDYCIYDYTEGGINAVSRYMADSQPDADSDEYVVLKAMSESFHTLVQVEDVLPGVGVRANDLMGSKQFLLIDMGLSKTAAKGIVIATRILPFEDFAITSGAPLPVNREMLSEILDFAHQFGSEDDKRITLDMRQKADLTAAIIRTCLEDDSSGEIEYEDAGIEPVTPPLRRETRIGRNDPCPCGSGKKYKRCCGR